MKKVDNKIRCPWPANDSLYIKYHDKEWGVPVHNDKKLFEFLLLEGFQAGLSLSVSYTHLDVYKRQVPFSFKFFIG